MERTVKLYHISQASSSEILDIQKNGLSSECWNSCIGGQHKGFYFFTRKLWAKEWMERQSDSRGKFAYLCCAEIPKKEIQFPTWRLDLFFNQIVINKASQALWKLYFDKADENGFFKLNLKSKTAFQKKENQSLGRGFCEENVQITGLIFQDKKCMVLYQKTSSKESFSIELTSEMFSSNLGIADTLIEHLCQQDKKFLSYYNKKLHQNITDVFTLGAIKCVKHQKIPVSVQEYDLSKDYFFEDYSSFLAFFVALYSEFKNGIIKSKVGPRKIEKNTSFISLDTISEKLYNQAKTR